MHSIHKLRDPVLRLTDNLYGVARTVDLASALRYGRALVTNAASVVSSRNLRPLDACMQPGTSTFNIDGTRITLDGNDFSSAREMYCRRVYLSHPNVTLRSGDTVVDLGANIGLFTLLAAKRECQVLAVEAQAGFAREIEKRLEAHGCRERVRIECALVGGGAGVFSRAEDVSKASHYQPGQKVTVVDMGALLERCGIKRIGFLKADIEGAEFSIFARLEPWMHLVDQIAMEVHGHFGSANAIRAVLAQAGMRTALASDLLRPVTDLEGEPGGYLFAWRENTLARGAPT